MVDINILTKNIKYTMTESDIDSLKEKYNMYTKNDYHALISEHRLKNNKFYFFENSNKQYCNADLNDFVAISLGFKNAMIVSELYKNEEGYQITSKPTKNNEYSIGVIKSDPILENVIKEKKLFCHKLENEFQTMYIYSEEGILMYEILKITDKSERKLGYFGGIIAGKCLDYSDEDIEFYSMRLDFLDHLTSSGNHDYSSKQLLLRDNLDALKEYRKWWIVNKRFQYLKDYDYAMRYIDNFKKSYRLDMSEHKRFNL